jgi:glyoxylate carboligase
VAERLAAPVIKPVLGKGAIPDDSPYSAGGIGLLGVRSSRVTSRRRGGPSLIGNGAEIGRPLGTLLIAYG